MFSFIHIDSRVDPQLSPKRCRADGTLVGPQIGVAYLMGLQIAFCAEELATNVALVPRIPFRKLRRGYQLC